MSTKSIKNQVNCLPHQSQLIKEFYEENGYVIVKNVINSDKIADFIKVYNNFKSSKNYYYFAHDTNRFEKLEVDQERLLEHSILNPLDMLCQQELCQVLLNIICSDSISSLLTSVTDRQKHIIWQSIFIEKSHGIRPHQDHYYLDSDPAGHLVACWVALEDIQEDAGAFFVVPKSHHGSLISRDKKTPIFKHQDEHRYQVQQLMEDQNYQAIPLTPEKGSVILWHPFLIHGSFRNKNPLYSRKSLIIHFLPEGYGRLRHSNLIPKSTIASANPDILLSKQNVVQQVKSRLRYISYWLHKNWADCYRT